ncbi:MAG: hypothetical protein Q8Q06_02520, partial [bacterium]|nr:hypothetical protein [bacterium]
MNNNDNSDDNSSHQYASHPHLSFKRFLFYFITLGALVVIYLKFAELQLIGSLFTKANYLWLMGIIGLAVFSNYAQAYNYQKVLEVKGLKIKVGELFPMAFIVQFI